MPPLVNALQKIPSPLRAIGASDARSGACTGASGGGRAAGVGTTITTGAAGSGPGGPTVPGNPGYKALCQLWSS